MPRYSLFVVVLLSCLAPLTGCADESDASHDCHEESADGGELSGSDAAASDAGWSDVADARAGEVGSADAAGGEQDTEQLDVGEVVETADWYVAPDGDDANAGTEAEPLATLPEAMSRAAAGELVYLRGGVYERSETVWLRDVGGSESEPVRVWAFPGERPIFDFASAPADSEARGIAMRGVNGVHFKGIEVKNSPDIGIIIFSCDFITFEEIESHHHGRGSTWFGHGLAIREDSDNVLVLNSDFHHNVDRVERNGRIGNDGDGVQVGTGDGRGTGDDIVFRGVRFWANGDDGVDLFFALRPVTFEDCWAFDNGYEDDGSELGDGNGFKLGGAQGHAEHVVRRSMAWGNRRRGFDENDNGMSMTLTHNIAYDNDLRGYRISQGDGSTLRNNVSFRNANEDRFSSDEVQEANSWNLGLELSEADFVSLDPAAATGPRGADGSLPVIDFLRPAPNGKLVDAGADIGEAFLGSAPDLGPFEVQ